jgi:ABC-type lipoprotein release transport system permease subunit
MAGGSLMVQGMLAALRHAAHRLVRDPGLSLFGVQIADVAAFAGTCALPVGVALTAALLPARRAARLDPIAALRAE